MNSILEYFEKTVSLYPDKIAVDDGKSSFSFKEMQIKSQKIAACIRLDDKYRSCFMNGGQQPVGILAERCSETIVMFMAVLYSGNYYVPLNKDLPSDKLKKIIVNSGMPMLMGRTEAVKELDLDGISAAAVEYEDLVSSETGEGNGKNPSTEASPSDSLYMVYTSGSTGEPKGVVKSHGAMMSFVDAYVQQFGFDEQEILGNQTPFYFDASAKDVYLMVKTGLTMKIIPQELFSFPPKLIQFLNDNKVTFISWVPSALCFVTQLGTFREIVPETLKKVFFVGETFPMKQFHKWQDALPELKYVNLYGASELAGICCYYEAGLPEDHDALPVGKPLGNCRVFLVDNDTKSETGEIRVITESAKVGEIYIQSDALADGYYKDKEKTDSSFFYVNGIRTFKTGDMAWYDEEGNLNFAARSDSQIKHMGYRIELGEIEQAANNLPGVLKSCCLYNKDKRRIVLFVQMTDETDGKIIRNMLEEKVADYMVPQRVIVKKEFPMNANGKTDRQKLKEEI